MPIREGHAAVVYRRENGQDILYSQSLVFSCYVPLFVKFTYTFPPVMVINDKGDLLGVFNVSRFLFSTNSENITNAETHPHLTKVVAGYVLPFTTDIYCVPTLIGMGIYTTNLKFCTTMSGNKRAVCVKRQEDYSSMYLRYSMNKRMQSFFSKYYNQKSLYPLYTGVLPEGIYTPDDAKMFK